jgi:hypothetical protein
MSSLNSISRRISILTGHYLPNMNTTYQNQYRQLFNMMNTNSNTTNKMLSSSPWSFVRVDHVQVSMPKGQEAAAETFFRDILKFERLPKPPELEKRGGAWFRSPKTSADDKYAVEIHVGVEENFRPAKKAHPAIRVRNINELAKTLQTHGYTVEWDTSIASSKRFFVHDVFGNRFEFIDD